MIPALLLFGALAAPTAMAHAALWDPGMYGFNGSDPNSVNYNNGDPHLPLRAMDNLPYDKWWAHGWTHLPPKEGDFMELPAGGAYHAQLHCNRAYTTWRDTRIDPSTPFPEMACQSVGSLHTVLNFGEQVDDTKLGGTALSIAYESDVTKLRPKSFTVISVNYASVWKREIDYQIPAELPACPPGGCHCSWNWIHTSMNTNGQGRGEGYGSEMYHLLFKCNVTGSPYTTDQVQVAPGQISTLCEDAKANCTIGAKQPHFWSMPEGCNNFDPEPPTHNGRYGWADGAQNDIFVWAGGAPQTGTVGNPTSSGSTSAPASIEASPSSTESPTESSTMASSSSSAQDAAPTVVSHAVIDDSAQEPSSSSAVAEPSSSAAQALPSSIAESSASQEMPSSTIDQSSAAPSPTADASSFSSGSVSPSSVDVVSATLESESASILPSESASSEILPSVTGTWVESASSASATPEPVVEDEEECEEWEEGEVATESSSIESAVPTSTIEWQASQTDALEAEASSSAEGGSEAPFTTDLASSATYQAAASPTVTLAPEADADCNLSGSTETVTVYATTETAYTTIYVPAPTPTSAESSPAPSESSSPIPIDEPSPEQDVVTSADLASPAFSAFTAPEMPFDNSTLHSSQNETISLLYSLANSTLFTNGSLLFSNGTLLPFFNSTSSPLAGMNGTTADLSSFFNSNGTFIGFEISHNNKSDSSALVVDDNSTETVTVEAPSPSVPVPLPSPLMEGTMRRSRVRRERKMQHGARRR